MYRIVFPKAEELVFKTTMPYTSDLPINIPSIQKIPKKATSLYKDLS